MKATAATKWAPLRTSERAVARAAKEQEDEIAPNIDARERLLNPGFPR